MSSAQPPGGSIVRVLIQERLSLIAGAVVIVLAFGLGVMVGGAAIFGGVGVLIVLVAFTLLAWRNRHERVVGATAGGVIVNFGIAAVVVLLAVQLVPYGRAHSNPPATGEPAWASPETRRMMVDACYGCHSNEVEWPWYSNVAPISWVVTYHVDEGREHVNYSEFATDQHGADETIEVIREGEMPPAFYTAFGLHPEARLTDAQISQLIAGLARTPGLGEGNGHDD